MPNEKNFERTFNICKNWGLYCMEQTSVKDGIRLSCMLNGKKKEDGTYQKGMPLSVYCKNGECNYDNSIDYSKSLIDVDGGITASEYKKKNGEIASSLTLFADKVRKHEWKD